MIHLLFTVVAAEVVVVFLLLYKTPLLRKLATMGLDRLKRGRGPLVVKTVAGTFLVLLASNVYSMASIGERTEELGSLSPTDQVLMSRHLLESSLIGYSLLLALIIDRLHHYIRRLRALKKNVEAVSKQNRALEEAKSEDMSEVKSKDKEIANLNEQIKLLKAESNARVKEAKAAEANVLAQKKQSEGYHLEYNRLLEENHNLRNQLQSIDRRLSLSDSKKNT
ncbi:putative B-cell receptor-associated protein 31 [Iris pallida]|uniref:Endoplasmic reticulum transmembrane protein n=1 Tax=Iris pallida TaxID=29817 RepID=A0AAX6GZ18_IRIPA|nr:putative B-cell receptor-associated protein 31 [Iris pallida]